MRREMGRARRWVGVGLLALAPAAAWLATGVEVDNRLERWAAGDPAGERQYESFRSTFGSDEFIVVAVGGRPLFDEAALRTASEVLGRLESIPGVTRVQGFPAVYRDLFGGEDANELRTEMTSTPFYRGLLISPAGDTAGLLVQVEPTTDPSARRSLVRSVREASQPLRDAGFDVALVGSTVLIDALDEASVREARRSFPLAAFGSLVVLAVSLRSLRAMLAAAVSSGVAVVLTLGLLVAFHGSLNMLTAALPALLWVLGLSYAVHVLTRYRRRRRELSSGESMAAALAETTRPCVFSAITTALGFLSLLAAGLLPVRELGVVGAVGIMIALAASLTVAPLLGVVLGVPASRAQRGAAAMGRLAFPLRHPGTVLVAGTAALVLSVVSIPGIRLESNPLSFLPPDHPVARDYRFAGETLTGFYTMEVVIKTPVPWTDPAVWPVVDGLAASLAESPVVARVMSSFDLMRKLNHWDNAFDPAAYRLPASQDDAQRLLGLLDERGRAVLSSLTDRTGHTLRLSAVVKEMDEGKFLDLVADARTRVASLPPGYSGYVTGQVLRLVTAQQALVGTQVRSVGVAFAVIFAAIWLGLRSVRLTATALPPNLLPVLVMFAAMAWLAIPLDAATVMVASVALGIAVDNTIHYLVEVRRAREHGEDELSAASSALHLVAPAIIASTAAACTGFSALALSAFLPVRYFGVLAALMMVVALACHLLITPAILALVARKRGPRGARAPRPASAGPES